MCALTDEEREVFGNINPEDWNLSRYWYDKKKKKAKLNPKDDGTWRFNENIDDLPF